MVKARGSIRNGRKYHMMRVSDFAYRRLAKALELFAKAVEEKPGDYPLYAGRRVTLSDTIVRLTEGIET